MSNPGASDSDNSDLIDLSSPSSDTSSGELYIPRKVLNRERDYLDPTGEIVGTPRYPLRSQINSEHLAETEHPFKPEHPFNQSIESIQSIHRIHNSSRT